MSTSHAQTRRRLTTLLTSALCLPRWAFGMGLPPRPPLSIPFAAYRKGEVIETEMRVLEHRDYEFDLWFRFRRGDDQDRRRVFQLIADDYRDADGWLRKRNQVVLSLSIWEVTSQSDRLVFDKQLDKYEFGGGTGGDFTARRLAEVRLRPGLYRIRVESLRDVPALETVPIELRVGWFYNARPFDN